MHYEINITPSASEYIKKKIAEVNGIGFHLSIKKRGCSGYSYVPNIIHEVKDSDILLKEEEPKIYCEQNWLSFFKKISIDYQFDNTTGLKQKRLVIFSPVEESRCGCGESFYVELK